MQNPSAETGKFKTADGTITQSVLSYAKTFLVNFQNVWNNVNLEVVWSEKNTVMFTFYIWLSLIQIIFLICKFKKKGLTFAYKENTSYAMWGLVFGLKVLPLILA